jgi:acetyl-CoA synthetase/acetyltransferase
VLAERMAAAGAELLVAARADTIVPVLVIGLGGIWTELLDDVAIVPLPAGSDRIERALRSLRGAGLLTGGRGRPAADIGAAAALIERCGQLLLAGDVELIELNPVLVGEAGAVAVDASVRARSGARVGARGPASGSEARLDRAVDEPGPPVREVRAG